MATVEIYQDTIFGLHESCNLNTLVITLNTTEKIINGIYSLNGEGNRMQYTRPDKITYETSLASGVSELTLLKVDTVNQIVAGTFFGTLSDENGNQIEITDGRFDLTY